MRYESIRDFDYDGLDVRVWCLRCARGRVVSGMIWEPFLARRWSIDLREARRHFRCRTCGSHGAILLLPTRRDVGPIRTWSHAVEAFFHGNRARMKLVRKGRS